MDYIQRNYRQLHRGDDLVHFQIAVKETDLDIGVKKERYSAEFLEWVKKGIIDCRKPLEEYIINDKNFVQALNPYSVSPDAPPIVSRMAEAAAKAGVGPMAAVAGAMSECVGSMISRRSRDVIVENGGDIYLRTSRIRKIGIFAGESPLSNRIALEIRPEMTPLGICTSSGKIGHSLSFGNSDAVVILSPSTPLADAVATAAGNVVKTEADIQKAIEFASNINGVTGILIIYGEYLAAWGHVKLIPLDKDG